MSIKIEYKLSSLGQDFMDDHIRNPDIHLPCRRYLCAIEIHHFLFENSLHFIHFAVVSHFDQAIMDLSQVYLVANLVGCLTAHTSFPVLSSLKLSSVRRGISDVENVS